MDLHIDTETKFNEVQSAFNKAYPFLKLEFFTKNNFKKNDPSARKSIPARKKLGDYTTSPFKTTIEINEEMTVAELEKILKELLLIDVQVYRRSENLWLQTTITDKWSLKKQNEHGMETSLPHKDLY